MSWLGIVANVAKVGVGLLNGVLNGRRRAASNLSHEEYLAQNPHCAMYVKETGATLRMLAAYVVHSSEDISRVGKVLSFDAGDTLQQGDVAFVMTDNGLGGQDITATNNSTTTGYYVNFGSTSASGDLTSQQRYLGPKPSGTGNPSPNAVTVSVEMADYSLGNIVVTPQKIGSATTPSASNIGPLLPLSTVLGNAGFASIIAGALFYIYRDSAGGVAVTWQKSADGSAVSGLLIANTTRWQVTVSTTVNWSNPAIGTSTNSSIAPGATITATLPDNKSPVTSASVAAFYNGQNPQMIAQINAAAYAAMKAAGVEFYTTSFAADQDSDEALAGELTQIEKELLTVAASILSTHGADDSIVSKDVLRAYNKIGANVPALNRFLSKQKSAQGINKGMSRLSFE